MNALLWNVALMFVWALMTGSFTAGNFLVGFGVGMAILYTTNAVPGFPHYSRRSLNAVGLALFTLVELVKANFRVARDVLSRNERLEPGVIDVPLDAKTDVEVTLLAALITLTPGTTAVVVDDDEEVMWIHSTNVPGGDIERARRELKDGFERRILGVTR